MPLARTHLKPLADGEKIHPTDLLGTVGGGRTFFVKASTATGYAKFFTDYNFVEDATNSVYNTIEAAINACTAGRGDVIYVTPGHAETVTATSLNLDVAGVTIIGLGVGLNRPILTFGAAAATINVSAANCAVYNIDHLSNFDNVAAAYTLAAAKDFRLQNCTFREGSSVLTFLSIVVTGATANAADGLTVVGNTWTGLDVSPNAFISILEATNRLTVEDNDVFSAATNDVGHFITLAAFNILSARIRRNVLIVTGSTGAAVGIFLTGSGTASLGVVSDNFISSLDTTTELIATAGTGLDFFRNEYTGVADKSGYILPAIDSAA